MKPDHKAIPEEFDQYRDSYSDTVNDALIVPGLNGDYFARVKAEMLKEYAERKFADTSKLSVLDLGCGVWNYFALLDGKFGRFVGVDVSAECIEKAREDHPGAECFCYDGKRLPFERASFDIAYAICVVHHVHVDLRASFFADMHRVIKPGGHAMIFEHNPINPLTVRVVNRCPFDKDAVLLQQWETEKLLKNAGFTEVNSRTFLNIPSFGPLTRRIDQTLGLLPLGAQYLAFGVKA